MQEKVASGDFYTVSPVRFKKNSFIFNFLFHNSHDKFDRQIVISNQINQIES